MKNNILEEILDTWDQTVQKSELKQRSYAIFIIVLNSHNMDSQKMDFEHILVSW